MGFAVVKGGASYCEHKPVAFEPFATMCENHTLHTTDGKVRLSLRRSAIMIREQSRKSDQFVN